MGHAGFHGPRAGKHLGNEDEVLAELNADDSHPCNKAVIHDLKSLVAGLQGLSRKLVGHEVFAFDDRGSYRLHRRMRLREDADIAFDLVWPLDKLLDLGTDRSVLDLRKVSHNARLLQAQG